MGFSSTLLVLSPKPHKCGTHFFQKKWLQKKRLKKIYSFFSEIHVSSRGQLLGKLKMSDQMELSESRYLRRHIKKKKIICNVIIKHKEIKLCFVVKS